MNHWTDEELIESACGKGPADGHLAACPECAAACAALRANLFDLDLLEPPERDENYGEKIWDSIAASLPRYERPRSIGARLFSWRSLSYAAACALLLAGAFFAGRFWEQHQAGMASATPPQPPRPKAAAPATPRVVVVVLSDHLDRSERLLVELKHADDEELVSPLRDEAKALLAANHICRKQATKADDPELAAALDHLDRLLESLANAPGSLSAAQIARLQEEMNAEGLLFHVRVLRSRIPDQAGPASPPQKGSAI